jgi:hypothetical protein
MELTERLNSQKLATIQAGLPGEKSRLALLVLADASAFLQLPAAVIPTAAPPDSEAQKLILARAIDNLATSIPRLPDFFARQTTNRFTDLKISYLSEASDPVILEHQTFQPSDSYGGTVYYRDGHEVEETNEKQQGIRPRDGLVNWGVFGQLQRVVMTDIYKGKMAWLHWEQRATGPVAVFQYAIPKDNSNYVVKYCCDGLPGEAWHDFQFIPPFHGEIAIDPATGAVYRLVLITDLSPSDPIFQAKIMVEYEPVNIGGKMYVCPHKSVTITTAIAPFVHRGGCAGSGVDMDCHPHHVYKPKVTAINDTAYGSYHVFRAEMRILPAGSAGQENTSPLVSPAAPQLATPGP